MMKLMLLGKVDGLTMIAVLLLWSSTQLYLSNFFYYIDTSKIPGVLQWWKFCIQIQLLSFACKVSKAVMSTSVSANRKLPSQHCIFFDKLSTCFKGQFNVLYLSLIVLHIGVCLWYYLPSKRTFVQGSSHRHYKWKVKTYLLSSNLQ